jgi:Fe-S oxidoreductase
MDIGADSLNIAKATLALINKAGISPVISNDERCCGHDLLWTGDKDGFQKLAELNLKFIKDTGAKTIVTSCSECFRTLVKDYPDYVGELGIEVVHISQFLEKLLEENKLDLTHGYLRPT